MLKIEIFFFKKTQSTIKKFMRVLQNDEFTPFYQSLVQRRTQLRVFWKCKCNNWDTG